MKIIFKKIYNFLFTESSPRLMLAVAISSLIGILLSLVLFWVSGRANDLSSKYAIRAAWAAQFNAVNSVLKIAGTDEMARDAWFSYLLITDEDRNITDVERSKVRNMSDYTIHINRDSLGKANKAAQELLDKRNSWGTWASIISTLLIMSQIFNTMFTTIMMYLDIQNFKKNQTLPHPPKLV